MSSLLVRPQSPDQDHCVLDVTPESAGWKYVGFAVHRLESGESFEREFADRETCIVVMSGTVAIRAGEQEFNPLVSRDSVFDDAPPACVYVPAGLVIQISAISPAEVSLCTAPGEAGDQARLIAPEAISLDRRGEGTNTRYVRNILPESEQADSLLIAEVITPGGHWSSYPPHKHDADAVPEESALEETYYHKINPSQGFVVQRVYTDDRSIDETLSAQDGDCVLVPRGYHPVGAPHGYDSYYLNVMAGPRRTWIFRNDPEHDWIVSGNKESNDES